MCSGRSVELLELLRSANSGLSSKVQKFAGTGHSSPLHAAPQRPHVHSRNAYDARDKKDPGSRTAGVRWPIKLFLSKYQNEMSRLA